MIAVSFGEKTKREPYLEALRVVGVEFDENPATLDGLDGLMLTGGSDIDPARYGQENRGSENPDRLRDQRETALLEDALPRDIPVFAICRGMQLLNVHLGGTLIQHIEGHRVREQPDVHSVDITAGTQLATILSAGEYRVNSRHHQCVDRVGNGLVVAARAGDIVEALEMPAKRFVIAVQWHPEDRIDTADDRKLFEAFAQAIKNVTATARA